MYALAFGKLYLTADLVLSANPADRLAVCRLDAERLAAALSVVLKVDLKSVIAPVRPANYQYEKN